MLPFLVSVLLALLIFVPTCMKVSELFATSSQAKQDFVDFINEIKDFNEDAQVGDKLATILIMDDGNFIAFFKKDEGKTTISAWSIVEELSTTYKLYSHSYPANNCEKEWCACLCTDYDTNPKGEITQDEQPFLDFFESKGLEFRQNLDVVKYISDYECKSLICEDLDEGIIAEPWAIERDEKTTATKYRRTVITLEKTENGITFSST